MHTVIFFQAYIPTNTKVLKLSSALERILWDQLLCVRGRQPESDRRAAHFRFFLSSDYHFVPSLKDPTLVTVLSPSRGN